jgi:hypothetical protein
MSCKIRLLDNQSTRDWMDKRINLVGPETIPWISNGIKLIRIDGALEIAIFDN